MWQHAKRLFAILFFLFPLLGLGSSAGAVPESSTTLKDRVTEWVKQLDADDPARRDAAEKELLAADSKILEHLPRPDDPKLSTEQRFRLEKITSQLVERSTRQALKGSMLTISQDEMKLSEIIALLNSSGNKIDDLRAMLDQPVTDWNIRVKRGTKTFWEWIDEVQKDGHVSIYSAQSERSIGFVESPATEQPIAYAGVFRGCLDRVTLRRDFREEQGIPICQLDIRLSVEPKIRPVQIEVPAQGCLLRDDRGNSLDYLGPEIAHLRFEEGSTELRMPLRFQAPDPQALRLVGAEIPLDVMVATQPIEFVFSKPALQSDIKREQGGVIVWFESFTSEDGVWAVRLAIDRSKSKIDAESYLAVELSNEVFLRKPDGTRVPPEGGMNSQQLGENESEYEYLFVDAPGEPSDYVLVVRVTSGLIRERLAIKFVDIALP